MMNRSNFEQEDMDQTEQVIGAYTYRPNNAQSIDDVLVLYIRNNIEERFENILFLCNYLMVQMELQINHDQIRTYVTNTHEQILIINLGLHLKGSTDKYLYGIIIIDGIMHQSQYKYLWQIDQILSADQIITKYKFDIILYPLPLPSKISYFDNDLNKTDIDRLIDNYDYQQLTLNHVQNGYKLVIDRAEWIKLFKESINNDNSWIPMIINDHDQLQIARTKIIHIPSKNVYVGIQLEQSILPKEWQEVLPEAIVQCIHGYTERLSIVRDPKSICYASAAVSSSNSLSLVEMDQYYEQWVTDINICDLNKKLTTIANERDVEPEYVIQSFSKNTGRKACALSMREHGIKQGKALKIYDKADKLGLLSSKGNNMPELHDFNSYWVQVLQQQHKSQQEIIDHLTELISNLKDEMNEIDNNSFIEQPLSMNEELIISNYDVFDQMVQQMMDDLNQAMENMNLFRNENNDHQQYMNSESNTHHVQAYLY